MDEDEVVCEDCGDIECGGIVGGTGGAYFRMGRFKWLAVAGYKDVAGGETFRTIKRTRWGARRWVQRKAKELVLIRVAVLQAMEDGH